MSFTYTYTARNKDDPDRAMTFTIIENTLRVNLTGLDDRITDMIGKENRQTTLKEFFSSQSGSVILKAVERVSGLVHIHDVKPSLRDGELKLTCWRRIAGLRFAPLVLAMGAVDNPESAATFIEALKDRQDQVEYPGFFSGILDYWGTWIGALSGLIILIRQQHKKRGTRST